MKNNADALIVSQATKVAGYLCRERHKLALMRQQKLHSQVSVARSSNERERSRNGGMNGNAGGNERVSSGGF